MSHIMRRAEEHGLASLSLQQLRIEHFRAQRAQRHGGGPYGEDDPWDRHMDAVREEMRARLARTGPSIGVWTGDITQLSVDAIVNAANPKMLGGGGVDGAIHRAAGPDLREACRSVPEVEPGVRCPTGQARITKGFQLPARYVIHTVGPVWFGGEVGEDDALASAYGSVAELAKEHQLEAIAIPAISTGVFGFPADRAARIAVDTLRGWQAEHGTPQRIVLVGYDDEASETLRAALGPLADAP